MESTATDTSYALQAPPTTVVGGHAPVRMKRPGQAIGFIIRQSEGRDAPFDFPRGCAISRSRCRIHQTIRDSAASNDCAR